MERRDMELKGEVEEALSLGGARVGYVVAETGPETVEVEYPDDAPVAAGWPAQRGSWYLAPGSKLGGCREILEADGYHTAAAPNRGHARLRVHPGSGT